MLKVGICRRIGAGGESCNEGKETAGMHQGNLGYARFEAVAAGRRSKADEQTRSGSRFCRIRSCF
jgi:hypothetical protein